MWCWWSHHLQEFEYTSGCIMYILLIVWANERYPNCSQIWVKLFSKILLMWTVPPTVGYWPLQMISKIQRWALVRLSHRTSNWRRHLSKVQRNEVAPSCIFTCITNLVGAILPCTNQIEHWETTNTHHPQNLDFPLKQIWMLFLSKDPST